MLSLQQKRKLNMGHVVNLECSLVMLKSLNHYFWCAFLHNNMTVLKQLMFINQGTHGVLIYLESFLIWLQYNSCPLWKNPVDLKT